jgi:hypothetical protein
MTTVLPVSDSISAQLLYVEGTLQTVTLVDVSGARFAMTPNEVGELQWQVFNAMEKMKDGK